MFLVTIGFSQTLSDYNKVMKELVNAYNEEDVGKLNSLGRYNFSADGMAYLKEHFGKITHCEFMIVDSTDVDVHGRVTAYFAAVTEKQWYGSNVNALAFALTDDNKISSYRFMTKSEHSDSMLQKYYHKNMPH
jgi:hypothetical protein